MVKKIVHSYNSASFFYLTSEEKFSGGKCNRETALKIAYAKLFLLRSLDLDCMIKISNQELKCVKQFNCFFL